MLQQSKAQYIIGAKGVKSLPFALILVVAIGSLCYAQPTPLSPGTSSEPGEKVTTTRPTFRWQGVSGASKYGLYVSKYPYGEANIVYQNENISGTATSFTIPKDLEQGQKYRWNMRAFKNGHGLHFHHACTFIFHHQSRPLFHQVALLSRAKELQPRVPPFIGKAFQGQNGMVFTSASILMEQTM